jgi:hypothetical protein
VVLCIWTRFATVHIHVQPFHFHVPTQLILSHSNILQHTKKMSACLSFNSTSQTFASYQDAFDRYGQKKNYKVEIKVFRTFAKEFILSFIHQWLYSLRPGLFSFLIYTQTVDSLDECWASRKAATYTQDNTQNKRTQTSMP